MTIPASCRQRCWANALSSQSWVQDCARDADDALSGLADLCAADAKCAVAYGVRGLVDAAMAPFDAGPVPATYTNPADTATTLSFKIAAEDIADLIFPMQTGQNAVRLLPGFLQSLTSDGVVSLTVVMAPLYGPDLLADRCAYPATDGATTALAHAAIACSDDPVTSPDDLILAQDPSNCARTPGQGLTAQYIDLCATVAVPWPPDSADV